MLPRLAVIGAGHWGTNLVRNLHSLQALSLICDRNKQNLETIAAAYPEVKTCLAPHTVYQNSNIDGIVIATPAETHFAIAREALLAGKHVYVEKPLVLEEDQGVELIDLADRMGKILMVGHLLQYHPAFLRLKELVEEGALGRINYLYSNRLNLGKVRREENILWSFAPHDISMILSLVGEHPDRVSATGGNYLHKKIADVTTTHLSFPSGINAHLFVSWLHPYKEQKLIVVGEKKMAVFDDLEDWGDKLRLYPHQINWQNNIPTLTKVKAERVALDPAEPLRNECRHFLECIAGCQPPVTDGYEGLRVLRILKASQQSLDHGGQVIQLPEARTRTTLGSKAYFAHPTSIIDQGATIGEHCKIWHFSHILSRTTLGDSCNIGQNVMIGPEATIGNNCKIQNNVSIFQGVTLEDHVFCGPSMVFTNVHTPRSHIPRMTELKKTLVKTGATLGANATIVCGNTIGRYAFIGAGAVVTKDVPDHALVYGNPARQIGWVCQCGERLSDDYRCKTCGAIYRHNGQAGLVEIQDYQHES